MRRTVAIVYLSVLVGLPVVYVFVGALRRGLGPFWSEVTQGPALDALRLSLEVAAIAVPLNTLTGVGAALLVVRHRFWGRRLLDLAFDVPVAVSPVIIGVSLVLAYSRIGWFGSPLSRLGVQVLFSLPGIVLATTAVSLPYVLRSVAPVLAEIGRDQEHAATTLGAGRWRVFWTVTLPSVRWAILYGVTLSIARTLGEFGAVLVVSGNIAGRTQTLPIYLYDSWDQRFDVLGSFSGALTLAAISLGAIGFMALMRRRERRLHVSGG